MSTAVDFSRIGLPEELLEQLRPTKIQRKSAETERRIVGVLFDADGVASLDMILVGLYRAHGTVYKRRFVQNKLYRMIYNGIVDKGELDGLKKGVYRLTDRTLQEGRP